MIKKISYVLDRRQKINIALLLVIIFIGAFVELLGVSMILPIINIALSPNVLDEKWYYIWIKENLGITEVNHMIVFLAALLIGIYILKNIYVTFMYNEQYRFTINNQRKLAVKLMDCYMHQKYPFHVSKNVAELQRNITTDVNGFYTVVLNVLQFLAEMSVCTILIVFLMFEDWMTTLIVAILVGIFVLFFGLFFKKVLGRKGEENRRLNVEITKWILQAFSGIKEIKVINGERFFVKNYEKTYCQAATIKRHQMMLTFIPRPLMETVCISGLLITMIIKLSFGQGNIVDFIPTLSVFAIAAFRMLPSFNRITGYLSNVMFSKSSIDAVYNDLVEVEDLIKQCEKEEKDSIVVKLDDKIRMENVSFKYPESDKWILDNANLTIKKNTSIALIGTSGAGKTTVADLLLGLFEPQKGRITVDGLDINSHLQSWHRSLGYIPQTIYLMDDTIRANIAFGISKDEINDENMQKALKEAQLDEFVKGLKDGLDTVIGEHGVKLSGGQRQRIGIARALYRNPEVLILDEATSALDNNTEKEVMEAIDGLHGTRTLVVIAHRLSTIKKCDYIFEVKNGKVIEKNKSDVLSD